MDTLLQVFEAALFLALILERITELFIVPFVPDQFKPYVPFGTLVLGLGFSLVFAVDIVTPVLESLGTVNSASWAGTVLTGVLIGGGSNLLHDIWPGDGPTSGGLN